jgi:D-sedoheptulose 7-phosphate isomerase
VSRAFVESALRKARESSETQRRFFEANAPRIASCAEHMAESFTRGAKLLSFGNGGSATDAEHLALEFVHPVIEKRPALPAFSLCASPAVLSAVANDSDFALVFVEQLRTLAKKGDIALGISTSGKAASVVRALGFARELGLLTIGFSGRDGGQLPSVAEFCFTVESFSVHRIQEAHGILIHVLWDLVQLSLGAEDVVG